MEKNFKQIKIIDEFLYILMSGGGFRFDFKKYVTPEAIELNKIRDLLFGNNYHKRSIGKAMELATKCKHPEAMWLSEIVPNKADWNLLGMTRCIQQHVEYNEADRAKGYYYIASMHMRRTFRDFMTIAKSERFVPAFVNRHDYFMLPCDTTELFIAANYGEREGFYRCGLAFQHGCGCEQNSREAKNCLEIAFALGSVDAALRLTDYYHLFTIERWNYLSFAALNGRAGAFLQKLDLVIPQDEYEIGNNGPLVMLMGKTLNGNIHDDYDRIFDCKASSETLTKAHIVLDYYKLQLRACRAAVDTWVLCARRLNFYKDLRNIISRILWNDRMLGLYE
ncbi:MAG: hypothetical protein K2Q45_09015 [Nitrosomonas sp.]|nr:hypothetical protein [Nitrosomonas sp.]